MTEKLCLECKNSYNVEALCFSDDPNGLICNGCVRSTETPDVLKISVEDIPRAGEKFGPLPK